jgi:nucleotide-binding universal stress UspA family protein
MKTILVPTDLSPSSINSTDYAAHLCKEVGATLILMHVYMLPTAVSEIPYVMVSAEELQQSSESGLRKEAERVKSLVNTEVEWIAQLGMPSDEITFMAQEKNIDLIVMGMKGAGELDKLVGSTTSAVIRKCHQPVLVVPEHATYAPFRMVSYATDFSYTADSSRFRALQFLINKFNASVVVVNIQKTAKIDVAVQHAGKERLDQLFEGIDHSYQIIEDDDIDHGLLEFARQHNPDLLVMVAHKHNLLERLFGAHHTRAMIYNTQTPLLVLHDSN